MKYSSARQLVFDYSAQDGPQPQLGVDGAASSALSTPAHLPEVTSYDPVYAETSRIAGRINAASISELEHDNLLREREALLKKKFDGAISRREQNRLEYVRWSLDRVEDAKYGNVLEALDTAVTRYENILDELKVLGIRLEEQLPRNKRK
jgi:hypothetical protein